MGIDDEGYAIHRLCSAKGGHAGRRRVQSARKTVPLLATVLHVADDSGIETIQSVSGLLLGNGAMVARSAWDGEVVGSIPVSPTGDT